MPSAASSPTRWPRARQGVKVHVLLDWVGSAKVEDSPIAEMTAAGVQIRKFYPPHWSNLGRFNNRTYRKLLVVDGHTGFTGGVGIAPQWTGNAQDPEHWRDSHFQVEGPVVAAGAVIAEYAPTMFHCKVMIVDELLVSVGSTNIDNRTFRLNDEATLNILDADFARQQTAVFAAHLALSRGLSHAQWQARPWQEKFKERLASLIGAQL